MTVAPSTLPAQSSAQKRASRTPKLSSVGVLRAEAYKLRTLPSPRVLFLVALALMASFGALYAWTLSMTYERIQNAKPGDRIPWGGSALPPEAVAEQLKHVVFYPAVAGATLGGLLFLSAAVNFIATEYSTGSIQSSLVSVPRRGLILLAKAVSISVVAFILGYAGSILGFILGLPVLPEAIRPEVDGGMYRLFALVGLHMVVLSWMGLGLGALLRSNVGGIVVAVILLFVLPLLLAVFSGVEWVKDITVYTPADLGNVMMTHDIDKVTDPNHTVRTLCFMAWGLVPLVAGWLRLRLDD